MLWMTLLLALLIALAAVGYVLWPLVSQEAPLLPVEDSRLSELLARKDNALRAIKDLEFDYQVGKIGDEDYQRLRERLDRQAISLLQQVEKVTPESTALDEQLEAEIAKMRRVQASSRVEEMAATTPVVSVQPMPVNGNQSGKIEPIPNPAGMNRFCTECGAKVDPSFKFCANCGAPVAKLSTATTE